MAKRGGSLLEMGAALGGWTAVIGAALGAVKGLASALVDLGSAALGYAGAALVGCYEIGYV